MVCCKDVLPVGVQKIRARSDNSHLAWGYPSFLGRKTKGCLGVARETRGRHAGRVPDSGRTDQGDTRRGGSPSVEMGICAEGPVGAESQSARKNLPAQEGCFGQGRLPALWP